MVDIVLTRRIIPVIAKLNFVGCKKNKICFLLDRLRRDCSVEAHEAHAYFSSPILIFPLLDCSI